MFTAGLLVSTHGSGVHGAGRALGLGEERAVRGRGGMGRCHARQAYRRAPHIHWRSWGCRAVGFYSFNLPNQNPKDSLKRKVYSYRPIPQMLVLCAFLILHAQLGIQPAAVLTTLAVTGHVSIYLILIRYFPSLGNNCRSDCGL